MAHSRKLEKFEESKKKELTDAIFDVIVRFIEENSGTAELNALKEEVRELKLKLEDAQELAYEIESKACDISAL